MINEKLTFGIDLGIGSCGWAVLRHPDGQNHGGETAAAGAWIFDVPETDKDRTPKNQVRRSDRLLRRVIRRRRVRMGELRRLFFDHGLLAAADADVLGRDALDPWELRARGLDKPLAGVELAVALGHIAKRRGFRSSAKRKAGANTAGDDGAMLVALERTRERLAGYRTLGEMFARDPEFAARRRNRIGTFDRIAGRDDLLAEVRTLFREQRRLGNATASVELEEAYVTIAFRQLSIQDSERQVGLCPFERDARRASRFAPSYERFRLLARLTALRITTPEGERSLSPEELARVTEEAGRTAKLSAKRVRSLIGLPPDQGFKQIRTEEEDRDIVARAGDAMAGTHVFRHVLGQALFAVTPPEVLDRAAHILTFFETHERIAAELGSAALPPPVTDALLTALDDPAAPFARFKGAGHISAKAARALIPHLEQGRRYDEACGLAGYDHAATRWTGRPQIATKAQFNTLVQDVGESIANPIARKALTEALKQLWAMRNRFGLPGRVHIELARDVGNSLEERQKQERRLKETTAERERERDEARRALGLVDVDGETLLRYRLWKEQMGKCCYTGRDIHVRQVIAGDNAVQVDHILPWSRFGDDSYVNKGLCLAGANQQKRDRTPFEWIKHEKGEADWERFAASVEANRNLPNRKKRNYVLKNADDAAERFRSRNLNDTRYAARLLAEAVKLFYPPGQRGERGGVRRVLTRPGALTAALRKAWGLESLKKVGGERVEDDRHHALDAVVVAAVSEAQVQRLTQSYQQWEQQGLGRPLRQVEEPWPGFRAQVKQAIFGDPGVFVARPERRRARGEGHQATIRQVRERDGETIVYERIAVIQLGLEKNRFNRDKAEKQLERIKDPDRNTAIVRAIRGWFDAGRPMDAPPKSPRGDVIGKIRLSSDMTPAVPVRGGTAGRGDMVRVDVFYQTDAKGRRKWFVVPIYPHQVMNKREWPQPPMYAVVANQKNEEKWTKMGNQHRFIFSLYPNSYVEVVKREGEIIEGYFQGMDRSTGAISLYDPSRKSLANKGIGTKSLLSIRKFSVDRFGNRAEIKSEVRTWHGEACMSPNPPG